MTDDLDIARFISKLQHHACGMPRRAPPVPGVMDVPLAFHLQVRMQNERLVLVAREFHEEMLAIGPHSHALHPVKACERIARYPHRGLSHLVAHHELHAFGQLQDGITLRHAAPLLL